MANNNNKTTGSSSSVSSEKIYDVFISYRRDKSREIARLLQLALERKGLKIFFDLEEIRNGQFNTKLYDAIGQSKNVVFLLTDGSMERCKNENDWVRLELEHALAKKINLVPVVPSGNEREIPTNLPSSLEPMRNLQIAKLDLDDFFDASIDMLLKNYLQNVQTEEERKRNESVFLLKVQEFKKNDGIIDKQERRILDKLATERRITPKRAKELIEQVENEYKYIFDPTAVNENVSLGYNVFISYRRDGGSSDAQMMYTRLTQDGYSVSYDIENLMNGNFNEELLKRVANCQNFIILLSKGCFDRTIAGLKREDDWMRLELATALYNKKNVIPIILPGFEFPPNLPEDINEVRYKNGPKYDFYYIDEFYKKLETKFLGQKESTKDDSKEVHAHIFDFGDLEYHYDNSLDEIFGDDSMYWREEARKQYVSMSRIIPFEELNKIDEAWEEAAKRGNSSKKGSATEKYMEVVARISVLQPCSLPFAMKLVSDGIDVKQKNWFDLALEKAQTGDVEYQYGIGTLYKYGIGVSKDASAAFRWFEHAAASNTNLQATAEVGAAYAFGLGVEVNYPAALENLNKAADANIVSALECLGNLYQNGLGVKIDYGKAAEYYKKASDGGNSAAMVAMGQMCELGQGTEKDMTKAYAWYRNATANGFALAQRKVAECLFEGKGTAPNAAEAIKYCQLAAEQNDFEAVAMLGKAYEEGWGVKKDKVLAEKLYRRAGEKGSVLGKQYLAELEADIQYKRGMELLQQKDYAGARSWFEKAASQGNVAAMEEMGFMSERGLGCEFDIPEAKEWYEKAVGKNYAPAFFDLGRLYFRGRDNIQRDYSKALELFKKAAGQWRTTDVDQQWKTLSAFYYLGRIYCEGLVSEKNVMLGLRCLIFGAYNGVLGCAKQLGRIYKFGEGVLPQKEIAEKWFQRCFEILNTPGRINFADDLEKYSVGGLYEYGNGTEVNDKETLKWYQASAALGNAQGYNSLGLFYRYGKGGLVGDLNKAMECFQQAANRGEEYAQYNLACMYNSKQCYNKAKAFEWMKKAAENGHSNAMYELSDMYRKGVITDQSDSEALKWLQASAENGYDFANAAIGECYENGLLGVAQDIGKAFELYQNAAKNKSTKGMYELARCFWHGIGTEKNPKETLHWLSLINYNSYPQYTKLLVELYYGDGNFKQNEENLNKLNSEENAKSLYKLYWRYRYGRGINTDIPRCLECLKAAATRGHKNAQNSLGWAYYKGDLGLERNAEKAFSFTMEAVLQGDPHGMETLFRMYRDGDGVVKNEAEALKWLEKAAAGNGENKAYGAVYELGECYENGWLGLPRDLQKAIQYYNLAAERERSTGGLYNIGRCYLNGIGLPKDLKAALGFLLKAAQKKDDDLDYDKKALQLLSDLYFGGKGFEVNEEQYSRIDANINQQMLCIFGNMYLQGTRIERDVNRAIQCLEMAAKRGFKNAFDYIGWTYFKLNNNAEAHKWAELGAQEGIAHSFELLYLLNKAEGKIEQAKECLAQADAKQAAYIELGECYENGWLGYEVNADKAFQYYKLAQGAKEVGGFYHVGRCTLHGIGTKQDVDQALLDLKLCADMQDCWLGYDEQAMRLLAETYQNGEVVEQDSASAESWLKKADERKAQNSL